MSASPTTPTPTGHTTTQPESGPESAACNPQPATCNPPLPQCRAIRTDGRRCRGTVLRGLHLCYSHYHHRFPALADPDHVSVPLLEDAASIQLLMTQVAHGLLSNKLDPARARTTIWAAQVAAFTLPRPARLKDPEPPGETVHRIGVDHESLICADPDPQPVTCHPQPVTCHLPSEPGQENGLNYLCSVPATAEETWKLLDAPHSLNQPPPEQRYIDPWHPAPPPQPVPAQYNVLPPLPPEPRPNHESGLPCQCPRCEERLQDSIRKYHGRPRKKSAPIDNPLCPSGNPTCLGSDSEFACRACRRLRNPVPPDLDDGHPESAPAEGNPCTSGAAPSSQPPAPSCSSGVIPDSRYLEDSAE
jgi:hypothetical protein